MFSPGSPNSVPSSAGPLSFNDKYRLCSRLGGGGQAEVYLALASGPAGFNKLVVLKQLRPEMLEQPELVAMFMDEARLAARLNHSNIVHTYEVGAGDAYFIAMEFLEGQPLSRIRVSPRAASLSPSFWVRIVSDALAGLHYAHELGDYDGSPLGIVHRDVSPQNVFVTYEGVVKLVDFGVAKAALNAVRTEAGAIKGKANYMAPEQVLGRADRRSDLFSMGIVLWEALAGRKLYTGEMIRVLHQVLHEPVPRLSKVAPGVDPRLDAIVSRAVEKDVAARYQTAQEMRDDLEAYLAESGESTRPEDVARFLQAAFADEREQTKKQVQSAVEGAGYEPGMSLPVLSSSSGVGRESPSSGGRMSTGASQLGVHVHGSTLDLRRPGARPRRSALVVAALGLAGVAAAYAFGARTGAAPAAPAPPAVSTTPATAALEVRSEPAGANVSWNGKNLGTTPLKLELPPGAYTLLFSKEGHQTEALVVDLPSPGATVSRSATLRPSATAPAAAPPTPAPARPGRAAPVAPARRPPPAAAPAPSPPAITPLPSPPRPKIQVVGDEAGKKIDVID